MDPPGETGARARAAAIWERPALCTHTNSSSGTALAACPAAWAAARSWSRANRSTRTGTKSGTRETGSSADRPASTADWTCSWVNVPAYR